VIRDSRSVIRGSSDRLSDLESRVSEHGSRISTLGPNFGLIIAMRRRPLLIAGLLAALVVGIYWPARQFEFIHYDDPQFITENPIIQKGLTANGLWYGLTQQVVGNWHPLTTWSHMLDCELFGPNAGAHHMVNVALHALNAALLFLMLRQLTRTTWRSALVAALFALHPLRVESVAWISERKDLLCGLFFILTLWAYARYAESRIPNLESRISDHESRINESTN